MSKRRFSALAPHMTSERPEVSSLHALRGLVRQKLIKEGIAAYAKDLKLEEKTTGSTDEQSVLRHGALEGLLKQVRIFMPSLSCHELPIFCHCSKSHLSLPYLHPQMAHSVSSSLRAINKTPHARERAQEAGEEEGRRGLRHNRTGTSELDRPLASTSAPFPPFSTPSPGSPRFPPRRYPKVRPTTRSIRLDVLGGQDICEVPYQHVAVQGWFRDQWFYFDRVILSTEFAAQWTVELSLPGSLSDPLSDLLSVEEPIMLCLVAFEDVGAHAEEDDWSATGHAEVIGIGMLHWRTILSTLPGRVHRTHVSLTVPGCPMGVEVHGGTLDVSLALVPTPSTTLAASKVKKELALDAKRHHEVALHAYQEVARFKVAHPSLAGAPLLAHDVDNILRPAAAFLRPVQHHARIPSPMHALRFVSLLQDRNGLFPEAFHVNEQLWTPAEAVLLDGRASPRERATLLYGLLVGLGVAAYVVFGTSIDGHAVWVMTVDPHVDEFGLDRPTFWDPVRGRVYAPGAVRTPGATPFTTVSTVIGTTGTFVNQQAAEIASVCFDLGDENEWVRLSFPNRPSRPELALVWPQPRWDERAEEVRLRCAIKRCLERYRGQQRLEAPVWSEQLDALSLMAVGSFEEEAISHREGHARQFVDQCVKDMVTNRGSFLGVPINIGTRSADDALEALLSSEEARGIVLARRGDPQFGCGVRVTAFCDGVVSVWVFVCVRRKEK